MFFGARITDLSKNPERLFLLTPVLFGIGIGVYFSFHHELPFISILDKTEDKPKDGQRTGQPQETRLAARQQFSPARPPKRAHSAA